MRLFKSDWVDRVLQVLKIPDDVPIENKRVTGAIANAQGQIESQNFESRKNVLKYDDVMDRQRHVIYDERRRVLEGADLKDQISTFVDDVVEGFVPARRRASRRSGTSRAVDRAQASSGRSASTSTSWRRRPATSRQHRPRRTSSRCSKPDAHDAYDRREAEVGAEVMRELERRVVLSVLDRKWREHLYEMDYLREGIYLRAYSQRDPLVEYQREGFDMFAAVMDGIKDEAVGFLFNLDVQVEEDDDEPVEEEFEPMRAEVPNAPARVVRPGEDDEDEAPASVFEKPTQVGREAPQVRAKGLDRPKQPQNLSYSAPSEQGEAEVAGSTAVERRRRVRRRRPQPAVPVRLGQEVQALPRRARWAHRAHGSRQLGRPHRAAVLLVCLCHDLGDDGQGDLARSLAAEVVPGGDVQLVETRHALGPEVGEQALRAAPAGHHRDVRRVRGERLAQRARGVGGVVVAQHHRVTGAQPDGPETRAAVVVGDDHDLVADGRGDRLDRGRDRVGAQQDHPAPLGLVVPPGLLAMRVGHRASLSARLTRTPAREHTHRSRRRSNRAATARDRWP